MNKTEITEFVLLGFNGQTQTKMGLAVFMTILYLLAVVGNGLIVLVVIAEPRLHNPMYFFLCNLSVVDLSLCTISAPQAIVNCLMDRPVMSFAMCYTQMYTGLYVGSAECFLLAVMAYDRYVAISNPLHYTIVMNGRVCILLAVALWTVSFLLSVFPCLVKPANFCGYNELNHITCELPALMKLICTDISEDQLTMYFTSTLTILFPFCFILFSYLRIIVAILRIHTAGGRWKAFSTCGSHLVVVGVLYGNCIVGYVKPQSKETQDSDIVISLVNLVVIPTLNPLIYTLRNQEVKSALKRLRKKL